MRILKINGTIADIDEQTAIGIDLQTYDVKNPAVRKVNVSNSFTIPITNKNLGLIGRLGGPQSIDNTIYDIITCDYFINNTQYITAAKIRVQGVYNDVQENEEKGRIEMFIYEKSDLWDLLKQEKWETFVANYYSYLTIPKSGSPFLGTWTNFIIPYITLGGLGNLFLPYLKGNNVETTKDMLLGLQAIGTYASGSHFCTFVKSIFEYIESAYSVNFFTGTSFDGNIWDDAVAQGMYIHIRDITPAGDPTTPDIFWFELSKDLAGVYGYMGLGEVDETRDLSVYDFVMSFIQQFDIIMDLNPDQTEIKLRRFDDLEEFAEVVDFSGNFEGVPKFIPFVEGFAQKSYIRFTTVADGLNENTNQKVLTSLNKNIDEEKELFKINNYLPLLTNEGGLITFPVPILDNTESLKSFKFMINSGDRIPEITSIRYNNTDRGVIESMVTVQLYVPALYSLASEYTLLDSALDYPKYYEHKKWMTSLDLLNFEFFKLYWIQELNGSYFVNKIKGFNPELSKQATEMELLKVSDRTPFIEGPPPPQPIVMEFTVAAGQSITIPHLSGYNYNYNVDYGDGSPVLKVTSYNDSNATHEYTLADAYEVKITGICETIFFDNAGSKLELTKVKSLGDIIYNKLSFFGCSNMTSFISGGDEDTSNITDLAEVFRDCLVLATLEINTWVVNAVTSLASSFYNVESLATLDISNWETPVLTDMSSTFRGMNIVESILIDNFDTSNVTTYFYTCQKCYALTAIDFTKINVSAATDMSRAFQECNALVIADSSNWIFTADCQLSGLFLLDSLISSEAEASVFWDNPLLTQHVSTFQGNTARSNYASIPNDWKGL